jgi:hypothetical protein
MILIKAKDFKNKNHKLVEIVKGSFIINRVSRHNKVTIRLKAGKKNTTTTLTCSNCITPQTQLKRTMHPTQFLVKQDPIELVIKKCGTCMWKYIKNCRKKPKIQGYDSNKIALYKFLICTNKNFGQRKNLSKPKCRKWKECVCQI